MLAEWGFGRQPLLILSPVAPQYHSANQRQRDKSEQSAEDHRIGDHC
jgi:hypothetical protein